MKTDFKRILIIQVNWLGDILFTTPTISAIRRTYPDAFIASLCAPRCIELLESNPDIDELILFDEKSTHKSIFSKIKTINEVRSKRFDLVVSFHRSMTRMLLAALSGIPKRIGYASKKRSWLLTDSVQSPTTEPHRVEYFLDIVRSIGIDAEDKNYKFCIPEDSTASALNILKRVGVGQADQFFVVNPGGNWPPKRWPPRLYGELCRELKERHNKKILITGAKKDKETADELIRISNNSAVSICGETTLKELGAIMKRASVVIANDSGPMHIAVSQRTPTVALFGPTSAKITGPYGDSRYKVINRWHDCQIPCYSSCNDYRCIEAISVKDVTKAIDELVR